METQPRLVDGPPRSIEAVIEFLTPPACRVELLGDLCEWYVSTPQYLMLACIHLPLKIFKHIRRSFNRMLFAAEVSALILAFGSASPVASLLVLTAVVLAVLTLCDAYCHPSEGTPKEAAVDAIAAAVVVVLSQAVLRIAAPQLALPAAVLVRGGAISLVMISAFRLLFRRTPDGLRLPPLHEAGTIQRANFMWVIAALTYLWTDTGAMPELIPHQDFFLAFVPIVVFALAFRLQKNDVFGLPGLKIPVPSQPDEDHERRELVRTKDGLWSGIEFVAVEMFSFVLLGLPLLGAALSPNVDWLRVEMRFVAFLGLVALWIYIRMANYAAACALQKQIDALDAKRKK